MQPIAIEVEPVANGWTLVVARIPPRACGANNLAAAERVRALVGAIDPRSFDPVPEAVAVAVQRDVPLEAKPPNCDGTPVRTPRASFPPYVTDDRDDDEGSLAEPARYPPGVACNVTGECE